MADQKPNPKKRKNQIISGYCALCGKGFRIGSAYDLLMVDNEARAVCKGGCDR